MEGLTGVSVGGPGLGLFGLTELSFGRLELELFRSTPSFDESGLEPVSVASLVALSSICVPMPVFSNHGALRNSEVV